MKNSKRLDIILYTTLSRGCMRRRNYRRQCARLFRNAGSATNAFTIAKARDSTSKISISCDARERERMTEREKKRATLSHRYSQRLKLTMWSWLTISLDVKVISGTRHKTLFLSYSRRYRTWKRENTLCRNFPVCSQYVKICNSRNYFILKMKRL